MAKGGLHNREDVGKHNQAAVLFSGWWAIGGPPQKRAPNLPPCVWWGKSGGHCIDIDIQYTASGVFLNRGVGTFRCLLFELSFCSKASQSISQSGITEMMTTQIGVVDEDCGHHHPAKQDDIYDLSRCHVHLGKNFCPRSHAARVNGAWNAAGTKSYHSSNRLYFISNRINGRSTKDSCLVLLADLELVCIWLLVSCAPSP